MSRTPAVSPNQFASFGDLLKYLRRRAGLTQRELSIAVGYSESQISRLEQNQRVPDQATLSALFLPALHIENEPDWAARLLLLAAEARREEISTSDRSEIPATPNNLPLQLTSFVGREPEIAEVNQLLSHHLAGGRVGKRDQVRLVTLIGPGGAGKTRLALQVAAGVLAAFPDGVRLVELAPLTDPALVPQTVATVLGMREEGGRPLLAMLIDHLRTKNLLLVLDNCEHLVAACAQLADVLLRACPALHILATSREVLGIAGEAAIPVPSLSLPALRPSLVPETLIQSEAGQLFVDRAARALPGFAVTHQNALAVAQVCHRLDGLPLAIELAAVRVKMLTVEQIVERLEDRFHLLTGGSRTALPRHQALAALIDWSYDLLSEAERALLRRLSVFAGGWTLEAAEAVCSDKDEGGTIKDEFHPVSLTLQPFDVLELLTQLVNKSLVAVERETGREARYRMLETIREYALARLVTSGESEIVRRKHTYFFRGLAQEADLQFSSPARGVWVKKLKPEQDNLRAALQWARESGDALARLQLAGALWLFWYQLGSLSEGRGWLESALAQAATLDAPAARAKALLAAGNLAWFQSEYVVARARLEEAVAICRGLGASGQRDLANSLLYLGAVERDQGDPAIARSLLEESVAISREIEDRYTLALVLVTLGRTVAVAGDPVAARPILEEGRTIFRELGDKYGQALALNNLGLAAFREGDYGRATALYHESIALFWQVEERIFTARCVEELAWTTCRQGNYGRATRLFGAAEAQREAFGASMPPAARAEHDQHVADARAQLAEATLSAAWAEGRAMTLEQAIEYAQALDE